jgi:hypothetical protein
MHKDEYRLYRQSPPWWQLTRQVHERSGGRCEYLTYENEAYYIDKLIRQPSTRCKRAGVDVHHLTYKRIGHERIGDLIHLCRRHHIIAHLMQSMCDVCTGPLIEVEEVEDLVDEAIAEVKGCPSEWAFENAFEKLYDIEGIMEMSDPDEYPQRWLCRQCSYPFFKDD